MNNSETNRIADQLQYAYAGPAWHGDHITKVLDGISVDQLSNKLDNSHSMAEIIEHMIAWRVFAIKNLIGEAYHIEESGPLNFPKSETLGEAYWADLKARLASNQEELLALIRSQSDEKLQETIKGRKYSYYILLHGIIQHDLYHLGQIVLLKKM